MHDGAIPEIFRNAAKLRANMTETENIIWEFLRTKPSGFKFRRQHPINKYILDFYCHRKRLSIEIDGGYHLNIEQKEKDNERTKYLKSVGIKEVRFTNKQVMGDKEKIVKQIEAELHADTPSGAGGSDGNKK